MAEAKFQTKPKSATTAFEETAEEFKTQANKTAAAFGMPVFDFPKFDLSSIEVPAAYREIAEKGIAQAKQNYEKLKVAAEETSDVIEETYTAASKGAADYGLKVIETIRANTNAQFDFARDLMGAKSAAEIVELSSAHARKQFETLTSQTKDFTALAQKVAADTTEPVKAGVTKALRSVA
jgi:phasin